MAKEFNTLVLNFQFKNTTTYVGTTGLAFGFSFGVEVVKLPRLWVLIPFRAKETK